MNISLPFEPKWSKYWIEKKLSKNFFKKPYDRFMWWRSYTPKNKPLSNKSLLKDRILNGDFEIGPYLLEVELVYHTMNDKYKKSITTGGEVDFSLYHQNTSIDRARKKRLLEDHEKEEFKKLSNLRDEFVKELNMSLEDYDKEVINTNSKTISFYLKMEKKYGKRTVRLKKIP